MNWRVIAALAAGLAVASCGGNPFTDSTGGGGGGDGGGGGGSGGAVANAVTQGRITSFAYTPGAGTMQVTVTAQDAAALTASYSRNGAFDIPDYEAYTYQETTSNRYVVALVRRVGSVTGIATMDAGQFVNSNFAGMAMRADAFAFDAASVRGTLGSAANYSGTYVGIMNMGTPSPGGPGGDLNPTIGYRTSGRTLITADFTEMSITGGVDNRVIVDPAATTDARLAGQTVVGGLVTLPSIGLFEAAITADGTFAGEVRIGTNAVGTYTGVFGENADEVAAVMVFQPLSIAELQEQGVAVLPSCATGGGPACP